MTGLLPETGWDPAYERTERMQSVRSSPWPRKRFVLPALALTVGIGAGDQDKTTNDAKPAAATPEPEPAATVTATKTVKVTRTVTAQAEADTDSGADPGSDSVYYANCSEARAAGAAPIRRGEPGYASHLDRDNDGVACDS